MAEYKRRRLRINFQLGSIFDEQKRRKQAMEANCDDSGDQAHKGYFMSWFRGGQSQASKNNVFGLSAHEMQN